MIQNVLAFIGFTWVCIVLMGLLDIIHVRVYVGVEDKVIVSKNQIKEMK